jgi:hypothetical protein
MHKKCNFSPKSFGGSEKSSTFAPAFGKTGAKERVL